MASRMDTEHRSDYSLSLLKVLKGEAWTRKQSLWRELGEPTQHLLLPLLGPRPWQPEELHLECQRNSPS